MKSVLVSAFALMLFNQAHAAQCTSEQNIDVAIEAMDTELKSDLDAKTLEIFNKLKREFTEAEYNEVQKYGKSLDTIQAVKLEAKLAAVLQEEALKLDSTAKCRRDTHLQRTDGAIDWVCYGQTHELKLLTNESNGYFKVMVEKKNKLTLAAPLSFTHVVEFSERYGRSENYNALTWILFPASKHGGSLLVENLVKFTKSNNWDVSFTEMTEKLKQSNLNCNR